MIKRIPLIAALIVCLCLVYYAVFSQPAVAQSAYPAPQQTGGLPNPTAIPLPTHAVSSTVESSSEFSGAAQAVLASISHRESIPPSSLVVINDHQADYTYLQRKFQAVKLLNTSVGGQIYGLLVDLNTGEIISDVASVDAAENHAKVLRFGKFQPALYDQLQTMQANELITVTLWINAGPKQSLGELELAATSMLATKYPEAQTAVQRRGQPLDVDNQSLARQIYKEYTDQLRAGIFQRIRPIVEVLKAKNIPTRYNAELPAVTVTLTKEELTLLAQRDDIGAIDKAVNPFGLSLAAAVPSDRVPDVWAHGVDGTGTTIAILEPDNVDFQSVSTECPAGTNNCFQYPSPWSREGLLHVGDHATLVASTAASYDSTYRGVAYGASVMSAGMTDVNPTQQAVDALTWAFNYGADIVNASIDYCTIYTSLDALDKAFDHYARFYRHTIVVSSGDTINCGGDAHVMSPAKAWNVLSVGAYEDNGDSNWTNDTPSWYSDYQNPSSPHSDRELPLVVAPGTLQGIAAGGNVLPWAGVSFATPQVAGLSALLISRSPWLNNWPEAIRAIVMASAVHNIDGPSGIPSGQGDLTDGAGGIDASLADQVAQTDCSGLTSTPSDVPCWWTEAFTPASFPAGSDLNRYFTATRGEHVRVAISWESNADCPNTFVCSFDELRTDLDLNIYQPGGQWLIGRGSYDNNYELVDFVAPQTGEYRIAVHNFSSSDTYNHLGIAWVKDASYISSLRNQYNGDSTISEFHVRNTGALPRFVTINYFDAYGNPTPHSVDTCGLYPGQECLINVGDAIEGQYRIPPGTMGSAVVDGKEDVFVWRFATYLPVIMVDGTTGASSPQVAPSTTSVDSPVLPVATPLAPAYP